MNARQEEVFDVCVKNLVLGCFCGYNATVLAYGQTGSGKTFSMGSGRADGIDPENQGIIPRVIRMIFSEIEKRKKKADILVKCSFLEIYNEDLHDLLDPIGKGSVTVREEPNGTVSVMNIVEEKVTNYEELESCLERGSNFRSTSSTLMN